LQKALLNTLRRGVVNAAAGSAAGFLEERTGPRFQDFSVRQAGREQLFHVIASPKSGIVKKSAFFGPFQ
jgi:hypothetical protein